MTLAIAIIGLVSAGIGLYYYLDKKFAKTPAEKAIDVIAKTEAALQKAKEGDTSDLEKLINR